MPPPFPFTPNPDIPPLSNQSGEDASVAGASSTSSSLPSLAPLAALSQECWGILDGQGRLTAVNPAWQQHLGWPQAALLEQSWLARVHPADLEQTQTAYNRIAEEIADTDTVQSNVSLSSVVQLENRYQDLSRNYRWMRWSIQSAGQKHCYIVGAVISRAAEAPPQAVFSTSVEEPTSSLVDSLSDQAAQLAKLYRLATSVSHLPNFPDSYASLFESLLESLRPNLPYDISGVLLLEEEASTTLPSPKAIHLFLRESAPLTAPLLEEIQQRLFKAFYVLAGESYPETTLYLHQTNHQGSNIKQELSLAPLENETQNHWPSRLFVPLANSNNGQERIIGLLFVASQTQDAFVEGNAQLLYSAADQLSLSLQQLQLLWFKTEKQYLNQILNKLPIGIVLLDTDYQIFFSNESAQIDLNHLGVVEQDNRLISIGSRSIQDLQQCSITQPHCREVAISSSPDFVFEILVKPLVPGTLQGDWMVVLLNVSDRYNAAKETERSLDKEKDLNVIKSRILRTVSHGYRSPLASILGSAQLLKIYPESLGADKNQRLLHLIEDSARHLNHLVDEMLGIEEIESGRLGFNPVKVDLHRFCNPILEEARLLGNSSHRISFKHQESCVFAYLDPSLLRQILVNLLSNAIKYSPKGGKVKLQISCSKQSVKFSVQDEGIGIPLPDQQKLFQSFYRASNSDFIKGSGLGLHITKKFVDLHQGQITFTSEEGVGSTFTVTVPDCQPE